MKTKEEHNADCKKYRAEHKEEIKIQRREYSANKGKKAIKRGILKRYGITPEQYTELFNKQEGCCAICGRHQTEFKAALGVDHDHITGIVRGLLCYRCNSFLGYVKDDIQILLKAINYLQKT
jgi:hypothetical protein